MYIPRSIDAALVAWRDDPYRKPLLLRGARQVGKSTCIQNLAKSFASFVQVNFEQQQDVRRVFDDDLDPQAICAKLEALSGTRIIPGKTLFFLDEIQACPRAIQSLRFFYEQYPALHVIGAGSLLEFALDELPSFGVGRIQSLFMYPLSFDEFLAALDETALLDAKRAASAEHPLNEALHKKLVRLLRTFLIVGGMPESVARWVEKRDYLLCQRVLADLLESFTSDFAKYRKRVPPQVLTAVFRSIPPQIGNKFTFSNIGEGVESRTGRTALELLTMAGLAIPVVHTAANGLPLGAEVNAKFCKYLLLDTGLMLKMQGLDLGEIILADDTRLVNNGKIAEMFAGLEFLKAAPPTERFPLYYWVRTARNAQADVDYVLASHGRIVPVEVKAGICGGMKSLWAFMQEKELDFAIRTSLENFSAYRGVQILPLYALADWQKRVPGAAKAVARGCGRTCPPEHR